MIIIKTPEFTIRICYLWLGTIPLWEQSVGDLTVSSVMSLSE